MIELYRTLQEIAMLLQLPTTFCAGRHFSKIIGNWSIAYAVAETFVDLHFIASQVGCFHSFRKTEQQWSEWWSIIGDRAIFFAAFNSSHQQGKKTVPRRPECHYVYVHVAETLGIPSGRASSAVRRYQEDDEVVVWRRGDVKGQLPTKRWYHPWFKQWNDAQLSY